jgi:hypothetical protein
VNQHFCDASEMEEATDLEKWSSKNQKEQVEHLEEQVEHLEERVDEQVLSLEEQVDEQVPSLASSSARGSASSDSTAGMSSVAHSGASGGFHDQGDHVKKTLLINYALRGANPRAADRPAGGWPP